jgi:hypothetical protein
MDTTQEQHERAVGEAFINWYNRQNCTEFRYHDRGADPPDLVYQSGSQELLLEITAAYYDADNATMLWQNARGVPGAKSIWISKNPDQKPIDNINAVLSKKCAKQYPANCVLALHLNPDITAEEELEALIAQIKVPVEHTFVGIYLGGLFPISHNSRGGYQWWKLA